MLARRILVLGFVFALLAVVGPVGPDGPVGAARAAGPSAYQAVLQVYERQGSVPACQFSAAELERALKGVDTYGAQYFADFTQAIQNALSGRASGACGSPAAAAAPSAAATPGAAPAGRVAAGPPAHFGPLTAATSAGVPAPIAVLGGLAVALALFGAFTALRRRTSSR